MNKIYYNNHEYLYNMGFSGIGIRPSGTYSISSNGIYDVTTYAFVDAQVVQSDITAEEIEDSFIMKTLSGTYNNNRITSVPSYAFWGFSQLTSINFPNVTTIGSFAFDRCSKLTNVTFGNITSIGPYAFRSCYSLNSIDLSNLSAIPSYAFNFCSTLQSINCPNVTSIYYEAFWGCHNLSNISFPTATLISGYAFEYCSALTNVYFPNVTQIHASAFYYCINLNQISLPKISLFSGANIFESCHNLISLNLTGISSIPILSLSNTFNFTPIGGYSTSAGQFGSIYVPASLYADFISANNWSFFSSRIVSVE